MAYCNKAKVQTNPRYKTFTQAIFTAGDESQFEQLLPREGPTWREISNDVLTQNIITHNFDTIMTKIPFLCDSETSTIRAIPALWNYLNLNSRDVYNTFLYMFHKFKKGIFVSIKNNKVLLFLPFSKVGFKNEWSHLITIDPQKYTTIQELLDKVSILSGYRPQKSLPIDEWQANDGMFRYEYQRNEGDNNLVILQDMFNTLVQKRQVPDLEFYINRRDFPLLARTRTEPYRNLYGSAYRRLRSHRYDKYAPILSCSKSDHFADVLIPTYEDWARIQWQKSKKVFPNACRQYPAIVPIPWKSKLPVAVFRGSSTGLGTTVQTNQRLKALALAESSDNAGRLDVGITLWNLRPRKHITSKYLETIERSSYKTAKKLSLQEQAHYRYILVLEGHVAAYRLSYELSAGSLIILAESQWKLWYGFLLVPFQHYVPVKEDLSDLLQTIDWCRQNDDECKRIAENGRNFYYQYLGETGVLDYLQNTLYNLAQSVGTYSWLPNLLDLSIQSEEDYLSSLQPPSSSSVVNNDNEYLYPIPPGPRCVGRLDAMRSVLQSKSPLPTITKLFTSTNVIIELIETNGFQAIRKLPLNNSKRQENIHEAYVGLKAVNTLVSKCPNFAYVHGLLPDGKMYMEYIAGVTLRDWLLSSDYNFKDYISILLQLNLALATAQHYTAFVHFDLYPWNIIIQTIKEPISFDYNVGKKVTDDDKDKGIVYRYTTNIIPIIIDFGKSRAVVYDKKYGLIDSGYISLYKSSKILDTFTLLYSTLNMLQGKITDTELASLLLIPQVAKVAPEGAGWDHIKWMSKYGRLISIVDENKHRDFCPLYFIDFLQGYYPDSNLSEIKTLSQRMSRGYPFFELTAMKTGNPQMALLETITRINRQTIPTSPNEITSVFISNLLHRRLADLDEKIQFSSFSSDEIKRKYTIIRNQILKTKAKIETKFITMDLPTNIEKIQLDSQISSDFIFKQTPKINLTDWLTILGLCSEVNFTDARIDVSSVTNINRFEYFGKIASNNTLMAIRFKVEDIQGVK